MLSVQGSTIARWKLLSRAIMMAQVKSLEIEMAEVTNGEHITVVTIVRCCPTPCISVEATAKGLIAYRSLES